MPAFGNQPLLTTIASCGSSTPGAACTSISFILAATPAVSGTSYVALHDDGPSINAAVAAACPGAPS